VEFLDAPVRDLFLVGDSPVRFAEQVLRFLESPETFNARLPALQSRIVGEYTWPRRADELLAHLRGCR